jgi:hypothetical protein
MAAGIDGTDGRSWHLPLPPLSGASQPESHAPGAPCGTPAEEEVVEVRVHVPA